MSRQRYRRFVEGRTQCITLAAQQETSAFVPRVLNMRLDLPHGRLVDQWSLLDTGLEAVADVNPINPPARRRANSS